MKKVITACLSAIILVALSSTPSYAMDVAGYQMPGQFSATWASGTDWKKYYKKQGKKYSKKVAKKKIRLSKVKKKLWKKKYWKKKVKKPVPVPEPSVLALMGAGLVGVVVMRRRPVN